MKAIPYGRQTITDEDIQEVIKTLKSDYLTQGPAIQAFETAFAEYTGARHAVAVANGTAALHLSCLVLDVNSSDTFITTPITFVASANCVLYSGGKVDFVDIDPGTFLMDLDLLEKKIQSHSPGTYTGVIPVDFTGLPVNLEKIRDLADEYDLKIIEDACHAPGGSFTDAGNQKQYCGNGRFADLSIFSFHPVKHIATGEGGMITTNDSNLHEKLLYLRTHGITKNPDLMDENHGGWYYEMMSLGYNYRLTDIQAALGASQLNSANAGFIRRNDIARRYREAFYNTPVKIQSLPRGTEHAYHLFVIRVENRSGLYDHLRSNNIFPQVHYIPVHLQPYYRNTGWKPGDFPLAEEYYEKCLSIPMYPGLKDEEQEYVIQKILEFVHE
ncbi:MAG TPA: UDP-4-amino-4,6-dideoxy-N-acetyl-beta-L-altrosamine transaminase [Bacteroides sp.]|nr:UDP-4-amino-4,6-dideoxy-N-acetyl-beta-L-altrosamine transaminase [Bacteroides sp.]